jgi:hypothetical protein
MFDFGFLGDLLGGAAEEPMQQIEEITGQAGEVVGQAAEQLPDAQSIVTDGIDSILPQ